MSKLETIIRDMVDKALEGIESKDQLSIVYIVVITPPSENGFGYRNGVYVLDRTYLDRAYMTVGDDGYYELTNKDVLEPFLEKQIAASEALIGQYSFDEVLSAWDARLIDPSYFVEELLDKIRD